MRPKSRRRWRRRSVGAEEAAVEVAQKKGLGRHWFCPGRGSSGRPPGGLVALSFGLWLNHLIDDLFARAPALGVAGLVLAAAAGLALIVLAGREVAGVHAPVAASPSFTSASPRRARPMISRRRGVSSANSARFTRRGRKRRRRAISCAIWRRTSSMAATSSTSPSAPSSIRSISKCGRKSPARPNAFRW